MNHHKSYINLFAQGPYATSWILGSRGLGGRHLVCRERPRVSVIMGVMVGQVHSRENHTSVQYFRANRWRRYMYLYDISFQEQGR